VQHHEETLADAVTLIACVPKPGPFAEGIGGSSGAASDRLFNDEVDLDDPGCSLLACFVADGGDFADKDDASKIGHLMERVFDVLWRRCGLTSTDIGVEGQGDSEDEDYGSGFPARTGHSATSEVSLLLRPN
jgi:hypothetical protein